MVFDTDVPPFRLTGPEYISITLEEFQESELLRIRTEIEKQLTSKELMQKNWQVDGSFHIFLYPFTCDSIYYPLLKEELLAVGWRHVDVRGDYNSLTIDLRKEPYEKEDHPNPVDWPET